MQHADRITSSPPKANKIIHDTTFRFNNPLLSRPSSSRSEKYFPPTILKRSPATLKSDRTHPSAEEYGHYTSASDSNLHPSNRPITKGVSGSLDQAFSTWPNRSYYPDL